MTKNASFLPLRPMSSSDGKPRHLSPVPVRERRVRHSDTSKSISPVPTQHVKTKTLVLTPVPGRLTPTGPGRVKAPPTCTAPSLQKVASTIHELNAAGVCFSLQEAHACAEKAMIVTSQVDGDGNVKEMSLTEHCDTKSASTQSLEGNNTPLISSSSTVITASSCGRSSLGSDAVVPALASTKEDPPLAVVRTETTFNSQFEASAGGAVRHLQDVSATVPDVFPPPTIAPASSSSSLSAQFTENLARQTSSRQGRSLQRWLFHPPTEGLVKQVAGTVPIARDGRIVLVSASRKEEWVLPKGGWDADETVEECAARETYEEGGMLGRLGGCLAPIVWARAKKGKKLGKRASVDQGVTSVSDGEREKDRGGKEDLRQRRPCKRAKKTASPESSPSTMNKAGASAVPCNDSLDPQNYSHVRLLLFPLYVSSVESNWPEKGRLRKLVDIDEAIQIMDAEKRAYFKRGLEMVKERGLHLLKP